MSVQDGNEIYKEFKLMVGSRIKGLSGDLWLEEHLKGKVVVSKDEYVVVSRKWLEELQKNPNDYSAYVVVVPRTRYETHVSIRKLLGKEALGE